MAYCYQLVQDNNDNKNKNFHQYNFQITVLILLLVKKNPQKTWKMILVNQQNFTTNLITELLRYKVSGLWRVA